jgi:hypothetical protein
MPPMLGYTPYVPILLLQQATFGTLTFDQPFFLSWLIEDGAHHTRQHNIVEWNEVSY